MVADEIGGNISNGGAAVIIYGAAVRCAAAGGVSICIVTDEGIE